MSLILPTHTDRGRVQLATDPAIKPFVEKLHNGEPSVGWTGYPELGLFLNLQNMFEIWHFPLGKKEYRVLQFAPILLHSNEVFRQLATHDQRKVDVLKDMQTHNAKVEAETEKRIEEALAPIHEKLDWALRKDLK